MGSKAMEGNDEKASVTTHGQHCLNCGAELVGTYCHECGQQATNTNSTVMEFILEYLNNAYMWDPKFIRTLWLLVCKPGFLTKAFLEGKAIPYVHPLKLNMFLLFVFITLFVVFAGRDNMSSGLNDIANDEKVLSHLQLNRKVNEEGYAEKLNASPRDTIQLLAPLYFAESFPEYIHHIATIEDSQGKGEDKWTASVPHAMIEDKLLIEAPGGYYRFGSEEGKKDMKLIETILVKMLEIVTEYLPMIILFTAPLLSFSVRLVQRRNRRSHLHHFIFSLHYTAFIELLIIAIYILFLVASPSKSILQDVVALCSCVYLTMAFRKVYEIRSWWKAIVKALFVHLVYYLICMSALILIFLVATVVIANNM